MAHSSRPDKDDVLKVVDTVLKKAILKPTPGRKHTAFPKRHLDLLHSWDIKKTKSWIDKKTDYIKYHECVQSDDHSDGYFDNTTDDGIDDIDKTEWM